MEYLDLLADIADRETWSDLYFEELVSSYVEPYTIEDYVDDNPDSLPNKIYTFKTAEESEPDKVYENFPDAKHMEAQEYAKDSLKEEGREEDSEDEIPSIEDLEGAFLADETIITHGSV